MEAGIVADWSLAHHGDMKTLYGLPHCDTVKRARRWLDDHGVAYLFHDFRKSGVPESDIERWLAQAGWNALLNRQGTTWRKLPPEERDAVVDVTSAKAILMAHPSLIKRPVVDWGDDLGVTVGFDPGLWESRL